jgi:1-deoxy-D-xylulose 5-phosphate reductoisomerase
VAAFLSGELKFPAIADVVERVVSDGVEAGIGFGDTSIELAEVLHADGWARDRARAVIDG